MARFEPWPRVVAHADWSVSPAKRWVAAAVLGQDGRYRARMPRPVGPLDGFLDQLAALAGPGGAVLLGLDLPIGLPAAYGARAGVADFRALLPRLGQGDWRDFFQIADRPEQITLARPFYPLRAGGRGTVTRRHLIEGLGLPDYGALLRRCDHPTGGRPAAAALFWTLGAQQVGKAAITAWRDLLIPALVTGRDLKIWPFDGTLDGLGAPGRIVVAETYPGECARHLGLTTGKRQPAARVANGAVLVRSAEALGVGLEAPLRRAIKQGFGPRPDGEDPFDATVGLLGMLQVVRGQRAPGEPDDPVIRRLEGWILGQAASASTQS